MRVFFCQDDEKEDDWGALSSANLTDLVTSRDLSSWKVAIPRLSTSQVRSNAGTHVGEKEMHLT